MSKRRTYRMETELLQRHRKTALEEQAGCCSYCFIPLTENTATADHKFARAKGGMNNQKNIVAACWECNNAKGKLSVGDFYKAIKHPAHGASIKIWLTWSRRRIWLATHRASRNIRRAVGLPNNTPIGRLESV